MEEQLCYVAEILRILQSAHVSLMLLECNFYHTTDTYLKLIVKRKRLASEDCVIKSLKEASPLRNKRELQFFLGLRTVYCRFVRNFCAYQKPTERYAAKEIPGSFRQIFCQTIWLLWKAYHCLSKYSNITSPTTTPAIFD